MSNIHTPSLRQQCGLMTARIGKIRLRATALVSSLLLMSAFLWALSFLAFDGNRSLLALASLAFVFGLRHAMDADHIAAIDSITRRLLYDGSPRISVGLMFSLGHSTVVVGLSLLLILSLHQVQVSLTHLMT